ncbi:hypothetical protein TI03_06015, partial [Achromatium sp. WMS1]
MFILKHTNQRPALLWLIGLFWISLTTIADDAENTAEQLPTIVITASRIAETIDSALVPVTIIDRAAIERSHAIDLPELIKHYTGITISNLGGTGKATEIYLRGTNPGH